MPTGRMLTGGPASCGVPGVIPPGVPCGVKPPPGVPCGVKPPPTPPHVPPICEFGVSPPVCDCDADKLWYPGGPAFMSTPNGDSPNAEPSPCCEPDADIELKPPPKPPPPPYWLMPPIPPNWSKPPPIPPYWSSIAKPPPCAGSCIGVFDGSHTL